MIFRPDYVEAVRPFIDQPLVKILAGVRRSGKSTIFEMIREELKQRGVGDDRILMKKYTEMDVPENITAKQMYDELTSAMTGEGRYYLLLDEIQEVTGWEKAVNSLLDRFQLQADVKRDLHLSDRAVYSDSGLYLVIPRIS